MAITKVTTGLISGDAASIDLNIDANTLFLDADTNRVGIGTTTPLKDFVVSNAGAEGFEIDAGATTNLSEIIVYNRSGSAWNTLRHSALAHEFYVSGAQKMKIDSSGRVGIGRTPSITNSKLEVGGADNVSLINVEASGATAGIGIGSSKMKFYYGGTERMSLDSSGNLGVTGTLGVTGVTTLSEDVTLTGANANIVWDKSADSLEFADGAYLKIGTGDDLQLFHNGSNSFIKDTGTGSLIMSSNQISIQKSDNSEAVAVFNEDGDCKFYYDDSLKLATVTGGIDITGTVVCDGGNFDGAATFNDSGAAVDFRIEGDTEQNLFFVDGSADKIGIGTNSPQAQLDLTVPNAKTAAGGVWGYLGKTNEGSNYSALQCFQIGNASVEDRMWKFQTIEQGVSNEGVIVLQQSGGEVAIGSTNHFAKLDVAGNIRASTGMLFGSDTAAANTLDDYEEGSWTPLLKNNADNSAATMSMQVGWYTKVGNLVTVGGSLVWSSNGSNANGGYTVISGLPFAAHDTANTRNGGCLGAVNGFTVADDESLSLVVDPSASFAYIIRQDGATYHHSNTIAASGAIYGFLITYHT